MREWVLFAVNIAGFVFVLLGGSYKYGKLNKEVQSNVEDVDDLKKFKEAQLVQNASFETKASIERCREQHGVSVRGLVTREELNVMSERFKESLSAIVDRLKEDREKNANQHTSFYETDDKVIEINTSLKETSRRVGSVETDVKQILVLVSKLATKAQVGE